MRAPAYRIRIEIYDDEVGEVVTKVDDVMMSNDEDNAPNIYIALKRFRNDDRTKHEMTHYPDEKHHE